MKRDGKGTNWLKYSEAFVWRDSRKPEQADGFALPLGDVVDGKVVIVPKALLTTAAQLLAGDVAGVPPEVMPLVHKCVAAYLRRATAGRKVVPPAPARQTSAKSETQAGPPLRTPTVETPLQHIELRMRMRRHAANLESIGG